MRTLLRLALSLLAVGTLADCGGTAPRTTGAPSLGLDARPIAGERDCSAGQFSLRLGGTRTALLRVNAAGGSGPRALLLALHGAGSGGARGGLHVFRALQDVPGLAVVAPAAAGTTWTLERKDIGFIDAALRRTFARCRIDPNRIAVGGFSAGAGLALQLGLVNGDLFTAVVALSPGGSLPDGRSGKPRIFIAHGTRDQVIPIERGGKALASMLEEEDYPVTYRAFEGGHTVRPELAAEAVRRLLNLS